MRSGQIFLIIPAYNEERRISNVLRAYSALLKKNGFNIIISSQSNDSTDSIIKGFCAKNRHISLIRDAGHGKGSNIINGIRYVLKKAKDLDIVGFVDADGAIDSKEIDRLAELLLERNLDGIIGSRYLEGSDVRGISLWRKFLSRSYNIIIRLAGMNYTDTQCGAKFFRAKSLKKIYKGLFETGWVFDLNLLFEMEKNSFKIIEVPIKYNHVENNSKVNVFTSLTVLIQTMHYFLKR